MFSLTLTKVLLTSLGCGLAVKQVAYGGVFLIHTPSFYFYFYFGCCYCCYITSVLRFSFNPGFDIFMGIGVPIESVFSDHKENVTFPVRGF